MGGMMLLGFKGYTDAYLNGWATGGIVGAAGCATLHYAVRDDPLRTLPYAAQEGFQSGARLGSKGAVMGATMEYLVNATR